VSERRLNYKHKYSLKYLQTEVSLLIFSNSMFRVCSNWTHICRPFFCRINRRKNTSMFFSKKKLNN